MDNSLYRSGSIWRQFGQPSSPEILLPAAQALVDLATSLRDRGDFLDSLALYQVAAACLQSKAERLSPAQAEAAATAWVNQGIAWRMLETAPAITAALHCFEEGIRLREPLAAAKEPGPVYNLAGAWIQRGDALRDLGENGAHSPSLQCQRHAADLMEPLAREADRRFARRFAIACINVADGLAQAGQMDEASAQARRVLAAIRLEDEPPATGDLPLLAAKAHLILALHGPLPERVESAEDGLKALDRAQGDGRVERLRRLLFQVAADGYARHQPHFLAEFIDEQLPVADAAGARAGLVPAALRAVRMALALATSGAFEGVAGAGLNRKLETLRSLRQTAERLAAAPPVSSP